MNEDTDDYDRGFVRGDDGRMRITITRKPHRTVTAACCICGTKEITDIAIDAASPFEATWVCFQCRRPRNCGYRAAIGFDEWVRWPSCDRSAYDRLAALGRALKEEAHARRH